MLLSNEIATSLRSLLTSAAVTQPQNSPSTSLLMLQHSRFPPIAQTKVIPDGPPPPIPPHPRRPAHPRVLPLNERTSDMRQSAALRSRDSALRGLLAETTGSVCGAAASGQLLASLLDRAAVSPAERRPVSLPPLPCPLRPRRPPSASPVSRSLNEASFRARAGSESALVTQPRPCLSSGSNFDAESRSRTASKPASQTHLHSPSEKARRSRVRKPPRRHLSRSRQPATAPTPTAEEARHPDAGGAHSPPGRRARSGSLPPLPRRPSHCPAVSQPARAGTEPLPAQPPPVATLPLPQPTSLTAEPNACVPVLLDLVASPTPAVDVAPPGVPLPATFSVAPGTPPLKTSGDSSDDRGDSGGSVTPEMIGAEVQQQTLAHSITEANTFVTAAAEITDTAEATGAPIAYATDVMAAPLPASEAPCELYPSFSPEQPMKSTSPPLPSPSPPPPAPDAVSMTLSPSPPLAATRRQLCLKRAGEAWMPEPPHAVSPDALASRVPASALVVSVQSREPAPLEAPDAQTVPTSRPTSAASVVCSSSVLSLRSPTPPPLLESQSSVGKVDAPHAECSAGSTSARAQCALVSFLSALAVAAPSLSAGVAISNSMSQLQMAHPARPQPPPPPPLLPLATRPPTRPRRPSSSGPTPAPPLPGGVLAIRTLADLLAAPPPPDAGPAPATGSSVLPVRPVAYARLAGVAVSATVAAILKVVPAWLASLKWTCFLLRSAVTSLALAK